jgi:selenocysteine-specific elongation factor
MATSQVRARIVLFDDSLLEPGSSAFAQLRSGEPMIGVYGQRFILRDETASRTVGGGMILEPVAHRRRRTMDVDRKEILRILQDESATDRVEQILRAARFQRPSDLGLCARSGAELSELPGIIDELIQTQRWELIPKTKVRATRGAIDDLTRRFLAWLRRFHVNNPELPGRKVDAVVGWLSRMTDPTLGRPLLDEFTRTKVVTMLGSFVCLPDFAPELSNADRKHLEAIIDELRNAGFQPPSLETLQSAGQLDRKRLDRLATLAVTMGELVFIEGRTYLHVDSEKRLRELVTELAAEPDGTTVAEVREALDSSRKYVVPFLEHLDRRGFTKRVGDRRILAD